LYYYFLLFFRFFGSRSSPALAGNACVPYPAGDSAPADLLSLAGFQAFKELSNSPLSLPSVPSIAGAKVELFPIRKASGRTFFHLLSHFFCVNRATRCKPHGCRQPRGKVFFRGKRRRTASRTRKHPATRHTLLYIRVSPSWGALNNKNTALSR